MANFLKTRSGLFVPEYDLRSAFDLQNPEKEGGFARGVSTEGDVLTQTVDGRDLNEVWLEFQQALLAWNADRSSIVNALTYTVSAPVEDVPQLAMDDFELASEFGEPKSIRGGGYFSLGFGFYWYDIAARFTWKFLAEATAAQVEAVHNQVLEADNRLVFNAVLKQIFNNTTRVADIRGTNYNVYPFYNNDGTVPPSYKTYTHTSTHQHYITSGAATVDSGDLDALELHLVHHGFGRQNGSQLILMANRTETATIRSFRVSTGSAFDFVPSAGQPPWLLPTVTGGVVYPGSAAAGSMGAAPNNWNGLNCIGQYGPWWVIEEDYIPTKYLFGFATGGQNVTNNPVGIREHQNAALRGLRLVKGRDNDYPLVDSFYNRGFGTGIRQRGAGVCMEITADASYDIPATYA
jgi:hypothetical protein